MIPIKLTLIDFVSHIKSEIDFTKFDMALINGSFEGNINITNGVGKTSIFTGIRFALFGKTNFSTKAKMVMRGKETCQVEYIFSVDGEIYKIFRKLNARTNNTSIEFSKKVDNKWDFKGWTCDTPTQTTDKIIKLIGMNDEAFVNIVYFRQNDVSGFTSANSTDRKKILREALQINIWDEYQKVAKDSEKKTIQQLGIIEERIKLFGDLNEEIENTKDFINKNDILLKEKEVMKEKLNALLVTCNNNIIEQEKVLFKNGIKSEQELNNELLIISNRSKEILEKKELLKQNILKNNEIYSFANNECSLLSSRLLQCYKDVLIVENKDREKLETEFRYISKEEIPLVIFSITFLKEKKEIESTYKRNIELSKIELKNLMSLEPGNECPTCLNKINNLDDILEKRSKKKIQIENRIKKYNELLKPIEKQIKEEENALEKSNLSMVEIERTGFMISKRMSEMSNIDVYNNQAQEELNKLCKEWKELKGKKEDILKIKENSNVKEIYLQMLDSKKKTDKDIEINKENAMKLKLEIEHFLKYKEVLLQKISERDVLYKEKENLMFDASVYAKLTTAFGKDGIQSIIMENITEELKQYTNSILKNICYKPINVDFVTQKQTGTGIWKEDFDIIIYIDNEAFDFEDISGGQQVRISIALRLALSQLLMRRLGSNVKFLLFDEVDQSLDKHGLEALYETIKSLAKEFKILIISHNEYMKEKFENVITVHMGANGSTII